MIQKLRPNLNISRKKKHLSQTVISIQHKNILIVYESLIQQNTNLLLNTP